jgi:hypothetical protein
MLALLLLLSVLGAALSSSGIGWDAKSFTVDGERTLLIGGETPSLIVLLARDWPVKRRS